MLRPASGANQVTFLAVCCTEGAKTTNTALVRPWSSSRQASDNVKGRLVCSSWSATCASSKVSAATRGVDSPSIKRDAAPPSAVIVPNVVKHAPEASMLIVTNPCDIMTAVAAKLSGLPPGRVFGSGTSLDSSRFRSLIAKELGVAIRSVHGYILGEHGDSSVPIWSQVSVGCSPLASAVDASLGTHQPGGVWSGMHQDVVKAAYSVIKAKGYTNWAIGLTVASIARAVLRDERRVLPVSVPAQGHHDIHHDVYLSLPAVVGAGGALSIISATLAPHETEMLQKSAEALHTTAAGLAF